MKIKIKLLLPLLIVLLAAGGIFFYSNSRPPDAARVQQSFAQALTADGRFEFSCMLETDGEQREYFWFTGERCGENRHLKGRVLGSPLELYYYDGNIYRYDEADGQWQTFAAEDIQQAAALYAELEPSGTFAYSELMEMNYQGRCPLNDKKVYQFQVVPVPTGWVADFFTDVGYTLYADHSGELQAAALKAVLKDDPDTILAAMLLFEEDNNIEIQPPDISN